MKQIAGTNVPENFSEMPLENYLAYTNLPDTASNMEIVATILGQPKRWAEDLTVSEAAQVLQCISYITVSPEHTDFSTSFEIEGVKYNVIDPILHESTTFQQFTQLDTAVKRYTDGISVLKNIDKILIHCVLPEGVKYADWIRNKDSHKAIRKMSTYDSLGGLNFFLLKSQDYLQDLAHYSQTILESLEPPVKRLSEKCKKSIIGTILSMFWPIETYLYGMKSLIYLASRYCLHSICLQKKPLLKAIKPVLSKQSGDCLGRILDTYK